MRRYIIEPRDQWLERIAQSGVVLGQQMPRSLWNERCCLEVSESDAEALQSQAEHHYREMVALTDRAIEEQHLGEFDLSLAEKRVIARSWELSDYMPTLFTRFDYHVAEDGGLHLSRVASGLASELLETAVAQWDWLQETAPWETQFNTISERVTESWREYHLTGRIVHFVYDQSDLRDTNIAEYLWDSALSAGVHALATPLDRLQVDRNTDELVDDQGRTIEVMVTAHDTVRLANSTLWDISSDLNVCLVEPHWKRLWLQPNWLSYCRASPSFSAGQRRVLRHRSGMSHELICSVWIVAGEVSGLGFSHVLAGNTNGAREFIPHLLVS